MADDGYDPRFDPAFQRGFDGETAFPARPAAAPASRHDARPAPERLIAPIPDELRARPRGKQVPPSERPQRLPDEYRLVPQRDPIEPGAHVEVPPPSLRSNPFLIAVLVLAVALIGAGVVIGSRIDLWYDDVSGDGPGFGLLNMLQFGAPLAIILGVASVIAVLMTLALRWRGRSEDRPLED